MIASSRSSFVSATRLMHLLASIPPAPSLREDFVSAESVACLERHLKGSTQLSGSKSGLGMGPQRGRMRRLPCVTQFVRIDSEDSRRWATDYGLSDVPENPARHRLSAPQPVSTSMRRRSTLYLSGCCRLVRRKGACSSSNQYHTNRRNASAGAWLSVLRGPSCNSAVLLLPPSQVLRLVWISSYGHGTGSRDRCGEPILPTPASAISDSVEVIWQQLLF